MSIPFSGGIVMMFGGASNSDLAHAGDLRGRRFLRINGGVLLPDKHGARPRPTSAPAGDVGSQEPHQRRRELIGPTGTGNGFGRGLDIHGGCMGQLKKGEFGREERKQSRKRSVILSTWAAEQSLNASAEGSCCHWALCIRKMLLRFAVSPDWG